jgi:biofilm PGA synthesis protein PgaA
MTLNWVARVIHMTRSPLVRFLFAFGLMLVGIVASAAASPLDAVRQARQSGNFMDALRLVQNLAQEHPDRADVFHEHLETVRALGAFQMARDLAARHPQWLTEAQRNNIDQDVLAVRLRHGKVAQDVASKDQRYRITDAALAAYTQLETRLHEQGNSADALARSTNDRIVGYRQKEAWNEAVALFEEHVGLHGMRAIPAYVKVAAADSYLALQRPSRTIALLQDALGEASGPRVWDWRLTLLCAFQDDGQFEAADATWSALHADVATAKREARDPMREQGASEWLARLSIVGINLERNANRLQVAGERLRQELAKTPFDLDLRVAQSGYLLNRAQPRAALAIAQRARVDHPDSMWAQIAAAEAQLDMSDLPKVKHTIAQMQQEYGVSRWTNRLTEQLDRRKSGVVRMELDTQHPVSNLGLRSTGDQHSSKVSLESPLQEDHWRFLVQRMDRRNKVDGTQVYRRRHYAGVRYESALLEAELGASVPVSTSTETPQPRWSGAHARASITFDDHWRVSAKVQRNSDDLPARAQQTGVWLNTYGLALQYRQHESRMFALDVEQGMFSDSNQRKSVGASWTERWVQGPRVQFETVAGLHGTRARTSSAAYFSPVRASSVSLAAILTHTIKSDQQTVWKQRVVLEPSLHSQHGQLIRSGIAGRYEHEWERYSRHGGRVSVQAAKRAYDGRPESRVSMALEYFWRFN